MKRILLALITILLCIIMLRAEIMWSITSPEGKNTSYLLGTHHVAPVSILDSIEGYKSAFDSVNAIMGEIDLVTNNELREEGMIMPFTSPDSAISRLLTPQQCDSVNEFIASVIGKNANLQAFDQFKPAVLTTSISMMITQQTMPGFNPKEQLDLYIQTLGKLTNKKILAFESINYQMSILLGTPISEQLDELMELVRNQESLSQYARKMNEAYMSQNLDALQTIIENPEAGTSAKELECLIYQRNRNWLPMIIDRMTIEPTMFVVGAGHLCGEQGLINLLRNEGYTVKPVK